MSKPDQDLLLLEDSEADRLRDATGGYVIVPVTLWELPPNVRTTSHIAMYVGLRAHASGTSGWRAWPGVRTLAAELGVKHITVTRLIRDLATLGFLRVATVTTAHGRHNEYTILREPTLEHALSRAVRANMLPIEAAQTHLDLKRGLQRASQGGMSSRGHTGGGMSPTAPTPSQGGSSRGPTGMSPTAHGTTEDLTSKTNHPLTPLQGGRDLAGSEPKARRRAATPPDPRVQPVLQAFDAGYQAKYGLPAVVPWGKAGRTIKRLPEAYTAEMLVTAVQRFFASDNAWIVSTGHSWEAYITRLPALLVQVESPTEAQPGAPAPHQEYVAPPAPPTSADTLAEADPETRARLLAIVGELQRNVPQVKARLGIREGGHL